MEKSNCPIENAITHLGGKWKLIILWHLMEHPVLRYGEIKRSLDGVTHKMLSQQLKELESDGLIHRKEYHQIPPKVEYSLTEQGKSLGPILIALNDWSLTYEK